MTKYRVKATCYKGPKTIHVDADNLEEASRKAKAKLSEGFHRFRVEEVPP